MSELKQTDVDKLKFICEKLAYVAFLDDNHGHLKRAGVTHDDILSFDVKLHVSEYLAEDEDEEDDLELRFRFTVNIDDNPKREVSFQYYHKQFSPAILDQLIVSNGSWQQYAFHFGRPNQLVMFDAEFLLEEELGVLVE